MTDTSSPQPAGRQVTRRVLLATGVAALAVGAGATELANVAERSGATVPTSVVAPGEDLMEEHGVLKRVLLIYDEATRRIAAGQSPPAAAIRGGAEIIHDFIEGFHEALEEGYVFPRLQAAGQLVATVNTLLLQHARGRQLTQLILADATATGLAATATRDRVVAAMASFVRMYQPHEAREDTVVFPAFRAVLTSEQLDQIGQTFAALQRNQFGADGFAGIVNQVAAIEVDLGIYDLDQFTPAAILPAAG